MTDICKDVQVCYLLHSMTQYHNAFIVTSDNVALTDTFTHGCQYCFKWLDPPCFFVSSWPTIALYPKCQYFIIAPSSSHVNTHLFVYNIVGLSPHYISYLFTSLLSKNTWLQCVCVCVQKWFEWNFRFNDMKCDFVSCIQLTNFPTDAGWRLVCLVYEIYLR